MKTDQRRSIATLAALAAVCLLATGLTASATVRVWTDDLNRAWQGEFLRMDGATAVFLVNGKEYPFPIVHMSTADKLAIFKLRAAPSAASAAPTGASPAAPVSPGGGAGKSWSFGSVALEPGKTVETDLPLSPEYSQSITKYYGAATPVTHLLASLAVPAGFDGDKPQKVLVVSVSATGGGGSIALAKDTFTQDALAHGWTVLAADGPDGKPKGSNDNILYRLDLLKATLAEFNTRFPNAKAEWTFATAGFSGGCGYASHQALWFSAQGYRVGGMLLHNGAYPPNEWEQRAELRGNTSRWHQIPVFISWGQKDDIAVPAMMKTTIDTTKRLYQKVRAESHPGGHQVWREHIGLALEWFDSLAPGAGH